MPDFSVPQNFQTSNVPHPATCSMGTGALSLGVNWPGRGTDHTPPSSRLNGLDSDKYCDSRCRQQQPHYSPLWFSYWAFRGLLYLVKSYWTWNHSSSDRWSIQLEGRGHHVCYLIKAECTSEAAVKKQKYSSDIN